MCHEKAYQIINRVSWMRELVAAASVGTNSETTTDLHNCKNRIFAALMQNLLPYWTESAIVKW